MKPIRLIIQIAALVLACLIVYWFVSTMPAPVGVSIIGRTNNFAGVPIVVFQVTNSSNLSRVISYGTQTQKPGPWVWYSTTSQVKEFVFSQSLPARSASTFTFSAPTESGPWRAYVIYSWPPGSIMASFDNFLRRINWRRRSVITIIGSEPIEK